MYNFLNRIPIWNAKVSNTFLRNAYISGVYTYLLTLVYKNISKSTGFAKISTPNT